MFERVKIIKVVMPTVTTQNRLTVALTSYGLQSTDIASIKEAVIIATKVAAGTGRVQDESLAISGSNLVIAEGATGFVTGDLFYVALVWGLETQTGTASTV